MQFPLKMGVFDGRIAELENILVDNFNLYKSYTCFFLSHCHSDHMNGLHHLFSNPNHHIYCSPISKLILVNKYKPNNKNIIRELTSTSVITIPGNDFAPSYQLTVTPISAGHCPGSIMFLFETLNQTVLYTGDFRISKNDISKFKAFHCKNQVRTINKIYLDTTFLNEDYWNFPLRSEVVNKLVTLVQGWTKVSSNQVVLQTSARFGYEYVFIEIAERLNCKIHVSDFVYDIFHNVPEVGVYLTKDGGTTQVHATCTYDKLSLDPHHKVLRIKLSAQWYKTTKDKVYDDKDFVVVKNPNCVLMCYSTHSSCSELVDFVSYLKPQSIEICTAAVGLTEEDTRDYVDRLTSSYRAPQAEELDNSNPTMISMKKDYKFDLKLPKGEVDTINCDDFFFPED